MGSCQFRGLLSDLTRLDIRDLLSDLIRLDMISDVLRSVAFVAEHGASLQKINKKNEDKVYFD